MRIHRSEIDNVHWIETSLVRADGKQEFRERPKYGNKHAVFYPNSEWGEVHFDQHNALDFPNGTVDHLAKYTEEKANIPEQIAKVGIVLGALVVGAAVIKFLGDEV